MSYHFQFCKVPSIWFAHAANNIVGIYLFLFLKQSRLRSRFRVESGYFNKSERVIPECPVRQSIFGPQRVVRDDGSFEKLLNSYFKELPALPASIVKSSFMENLFTLRATDICLPGQK